MCEDACIPRRSQDLFIPHRLQIALRDADAFVSQEAGQTIQAKPILQFLMGKGMAAGMRRDAHKRIDAHRFPRFFHKLIDRFGRLPFFERK